MNPSNEKKDVEIVRQCVMCKQTVKILVSEREFQHWRSGQYVQDSLISLSADDREILICGKCFDQLVGKEQISGEA